MEVLEPEPVASSNPSDSESEEDSESSSGGAESEESEVAQETGGAASGGGSEAESGEASAVQEMVQEGLIENEQELESLEEEQAASASAGGGAEGGESADEADAAAEAELAESGQSGGGSPSDLESGAEAAGGDPMADPMAEDEMAGGPAGAAGTSALDAELMESLQVFEGEMAGRITVLASANPEDLADLEGGAEPMGSDGDQEGEGSPDQTGEGPGLVLVEGDLSLLEPGGEESRDGPVTSGVITSNGGLPPPDSQREGEFKDGRLIAKRIPEDIGDGSDDDVVARQIREAALNEEDPVLREKLWEEYRTYKKSIR